MSCNLRTPADIKGIVSIKFNIIIIIMKNKKSELKEKKFPITFSILGS